MDAENRPHGRLFPRVTGYLVTILAACFWTVLLAGWFIAPAAIQVTEDVPGRDNRPPPQTETAGATVRIGEFFQRYKGEPGMAGPAWPRFRGRTYDNTSRDPFTISSPLSVSTLWTVPVGEGHGAASVADGRVFLLDYDEQRKCDALRCLSSSTGEEIWRRFYSVPLKRNHGFSRSIPTVSGKYVVSMGPRGHVMCTAADSGAFLWGIDLAKDYHSEIPQWYTAQCPLIEDGQAVIVPGGDAFMIGVDLASGRTVWKVPRVPGVSLGHSSIVPMTLAGRRLYLYSAPGGLAGVSAEKQDRGRLLFVHREWDNAVVAPSPVPLPDGRVFLTAGYGGGSMMVRVWRENGEYKTRTLYRYRPKEGLACEQQTPILHNGLLYGVMPKDAGDYKSQFVCADPDSGKILWSTGKTLTFGLGPFLLADGRFLILGEKGTLTVLTADRTGYNVEGQQQIIPDGIDAWGPIALSGNILYVRDSTRLFAIKLM